MVVLPQQIERLRRLTIEGLTLEEQQPPTGFRDAVELYTVGIATIVTAISCSIAAETLLAGLTGIVPAALGYWQQRRRIALRRRSRLHGATEPAALSGSERVTLKGLAQPLGASAGGELTGEPCVTASLVVRRRAAGTIVAWRAHGGDFWVIPEGGERVLVRGARWLAGEIDERRHGLPEALARATGLSADEAEDVDVEERRVRFGEPVEVSGLVTEELVPEAGTYRDSYVRVLRAAPAHAVRVSRRS